MWSGSTLSAWVDRPISGMSEYKKNYFEGINGDINK